MVTKITHISNPMKGPRGGLSMMGSITLKNESGDVVWIRVDSPRGWSDGQQNMFDQVVATLTATFGAS